MTDTPSRMVRCPQCGHPALYSTENPFRPFCTERCRLIDLGAWAEGAYKIPEKKPSSDPLSSDDQYEDIDVPKINNEDDYDT